MGKNSQTEAELKEYLREIIEFMRASCKSYDDDINGEARRLAVCIGILVYDTVESPSVLTKLGLKDLSFIDNSPDHNPNIDLPFSGLAMVTIGKKQSRYVPRLGGNPNVPLKNVPFDAWWNKPVIIDNRMNLTITRGMVVIDVACTPFGGLDAKLNEKYDRILSKHPTGWIDTDKTTMMNLIEIEFASARQVAFELLRTLEDRFPEYFQESGFKH